MTRNDLYQMKPASVYGEKWRDCTPLGNGNTGVALYGGVCIEKIAISRADLWHHGYEKDLPDVSYSLKEMRDLEQKGQVVQACAKMFDALKSENYDIDVGYPRMLGCVRLCFDCKGVYGKYRRIIHMDSAESEINYKIDDTDFLRRTFVSRKRDIVVMQIKSSKSADFLLNHKFYDSFENEIEQEVKENDAKNARFSFENGCIIYSSKSEGEFFGIATKAVSDGTVEVSENEIKISNAKNTLILIKAFSKRKDRKRAEKSAVEDLNNTPNDYMRLFKENRILYTRLYNKADVRLYNGRKFHSNEELIARAMDSECSAELIEKLWRFGRYLFISGVAKKGLPFPLYGLWSCGYNRPWAAHVANENVQMIHWHAAVGGLNSLIYPLIDFYHSKMDGFRECAKKLFDCRGIYVGTILSPETKYIAPFVPVVLHFIGVAGWLSRHFYEYYLSTKDEKTFNKKILPFMIETAKFYEDYIYEDKKGNIVLYPACSPENSPLDYQNVTPTVTGHPMPVTKNPTIEVAIMKELLTNLVEISETHIELSKQADKWKTMLSKIPDYMINESGAVAEWMDKSVHDYYAHRHLSHLYPVFPGTEIEDTGRYELLPAFKKAVDMREIGYMTGWSLMHMAAIYSRLKDSKKVFDCFNMLSKVCLLDNFFTLHNDYRGMGITAIDMGDENFAPVQLDALLGSVNAVQEMLIFVSAKNIKLLPACPEKFSSGSANLNFFDGTVKLKWDLNKKHYEAEFKAKRDTSFRLELPFNAGVKQLEMKAGQIIVFNND